MKKTRGPRQQGQALSYKTHNDGEKNTALATTVGSLQVAEVKRGNTIQYLHLKIGLRYLSDMILITGFIQTKPSPFE